MQSLRHLLVGTDFSACADAATQCAITLANLGLARVTLVHVCELSTELGLPDAVATSALDEQLLTACSEHLAIEVARHAHCGVEVRGLLRTGKAWEKIHNVATDVGASLIVIGRRGQGGPAGAHVLGSVASRVLASATRPVLVVGSALDAAFVRAEVSL